MSQEAKALDDCSASRGKYKAITNLRAFFEKGCVSRGSIVSALTAYNSSCAEMGSEARDACIRAIFEVQVTPKSI